MFVSSLIAGRLLVQACIEAGKILSIQLAKQIDMDGRCKTCVHQDFDIQVLAAGLHIVHQRRSALSRIDGS